MHPARTRETTPAGHAEAKHGVRGVADIDRLVGNAVSTARSANALRADPGFPEAHAQGASLIEILTPPH
jgi:hypothetical protein